MTENILEKNLREFDFSEFSKIKDSLLENILQKYDEDNSTKTFKSLSQILAEEKLSDEELDYVAAAGTVQKDFTAAPSQQEKI